MTPRERARYSRWKPLRIWLRSHGLPVPPFASEPPSRVPNRHSLTIPRASDGGASITIPRAPR